ncbi:MULTISPECIES: helix-turn-helix domain-containing protein [unclassified Nocardiopsis]|uniref:helix-turn-helix domain-containing protein n=1 Tax=Nocardiopsis TaxID=2013 RepID=UPI00387A9AD6
MYKLEYREDDPFLSAVWYAEVTEPGAYLDPATEYWGIAFTVCPDRSTRVELAGPLPAPHTLPGVPGERHWGVELRPDIVVTGYDKAAMVGALVPLAVVGDRFALAGRLHRVPAFDRLVGFVHGLAECGALRVDADTRRMLGGDFGGWSERSRQRRIKAVTGLTRVRIDQVVRAREAARALRSGLTPGYVAAELGYSDQAHLTRSLVALRAERPSRLRPGGP